VFKKINLINGGKSEELNTRSVTVLVPRTLPPHYDGLSMAPRA